jgi:hypothetical protein
MEKPIHFLAQWTLESRFGRDILYLLPDKFVIGLSQGHYLDYKFDYFWQNNNDLQAYLIFLTI